MALAVAKAVPSEQLGLTTGALQWLRYEIGVGIACFAAALRRSRIVGAIEGRNGPRSRFGAKFLRLLRPNPVSGQLDLVED
jgi:hypothetical protein